jgi:hypothetical protein
MTAARDLAAALREAGADEQAASLLARDPASHTAVDHPGAVAFLLDRLREAGADEALEEQRSEKYRHALIAVVSIGVRAGQLGGTDAWLSSHLVSHA